MKLDNSKLFLLKNNCKMMLEGSVRSDLFPDCYQKFFDTKTVMKASRCAQDLLLIVETFSMKAFRIHTI